jgi:ubiquinone/menaquinone biosynthesis C-methylase UbiE
LNNLSEKREKSDEKTAYGSYIGFSMIATFFVLGVLGVVSIILGFLVGLFLSIFFWTIGAILTVVFLWPALALSSTNVAKQDLPRPLLSSCDFSEYEKPAILDCGCGAGRRAIPLAKRMPKGAFLTGIDIYSKGSISVNSLERVQKNAMLEGVADRTKFMVGSVTEIPFEDENFDVVTCVGVLHEIRTVQDREKALKEIHRVLKPKGSFYLGELDRVTMIPYMGLMALMTKDRAYWEQHMKQNGFKIMKSNVGRGVIELLARRD